MIKRIKFDFSEGDVIEFNNQSEPLYIFHHGVLERINNHEYCICMKNPPEKRWGKIIEDRWRTQ